MFILNLCDKAIYDRMNKGPEHKGPQTLVLRCLWRWQMYYLNTTNNLDYPFYLY